MNNDTIFALSSGHGKCGVSVIRISGNDLKSIFLKMLNKTDATPRQVYVCNLRDENKELIDQCVITYFDAPKSFTGEDVIEIYSHGAPAVVNKIFEYLTTLGARMATPGEFSKRAFYNNKMDLSDIDGLAALLNAQTEKQRQFALKSMMGGDSEIYNAWRAQMVEIAAYSAAVLDYDSDDLPKDIETKIIDKIKQLYSEIKNAISRYTAIRAIQGGFNIALVGETNVGKSSIFNCIVGQNRAIVSDIPGTTRDVISYTLDIDGYMVNISDTAGIRETDNDIEQMGIDRTHSEIENANLILRIESDRTILEPKENEILVINKSDLIDKQTNKNAIYVSAKTGDGIDRLMSAIRGKIADLMAGAESGLVINERTRELLNGTEQELDNAINKSDNNFDIISEHIRRAADNIGKILGTITATEVMDATFSQLCLGK